MVLMKQLDYFQLQFIIQEFYQKKKICKYLVVMIILVLLQVIEIHIVGEVTSIFNKKKPFKKLIF
jgi:hypothetical protein